MATIDRYYYIKNDEIAIVQRDTSGITVNGVVSDLISPSTSVTVKIHYTGRPVDFDGTASTESTLPAIFHKYIVSKVIAEGYKDPRNLDINAAQYFDMEFEKGIARARKESQSDYTSTGFIKAVDF